MSEQKTYPFDLKRALAGDAVCDCYGNPVIGLHRFDGLAPREQALYGVHNDDLLRR